MLTVKEICGHKNKRGHVGIELEVEGLQALPPIENNYWTSKKETSLRAFGMEYITQRPVLCDEDKPGIIKQVTEVVENYKVIKDSPRTSVHVHCNVLNYTYTQVMTAATCYWLLEPALMQYCGPSRVGNKFCLRLKDAEGLISLVKKSINISHSMSPFKAFYREHCKYAGLNLSAIHSFGSLEFRGMRGTLDPDLINLWSSSVYQLIEKAINNFKTPIEVLDFYYYCGPKKLASLVLPYELYNQLSIDEAECDEQAGILCSPMYGASWAKIEQQIKVYKEELPKLDYADTNITYPSLQSVPTTADIGSHPSLVWKKAFNYSKMSYSNNSNYCIHLLSYDPDLVHDITNLVDSIEGTTKTVSWLSKFCYKYRKQWKIKHHGN